MNKYTITKSFNSDELINIDEYIYFLSGLCNCDYDGIFTRGYIERVKNHIELLECFKNCIVQYDLSILPNSKINFLDYDIVNVTTGEILYFGGY